MEEDTVGILGWEDFQYRQSQSWAGTTLVHFEVECVSLPCQWWAALSLWHTVFFRDY